MQTFSGAVLAVSHDRYFLDKVGHKIFEVTGTGEVRQFLGGYSDYLQKQTPAEEKDDKKPEAQKGQKVNLNGEKPRFSYREKLEFETIDSEIADLEDELSKVEQALEENATDYVALTGLLEKKAEAERRLNEKMERWVYLNELHEKILESK